MLRRVRPGLSTRRGKGAMRDDEMRQQDLEFRRQLLRQAAEQVRAVDLAEARPMGGFQLGREPPTVGRERPARQDTPQLVRDNQRPGSASELARRYRSGELSPVEVTIWALEQAEASQPTLNAFITL